MTKRRNDKRDEPTNRTGNSPKGPRSIGVPKRRNDMSKRRYDMTKRHNGTTKRRNAIAKRRVEHFVQDLPSYPPPSAFPLSGGRVRLHVGYPASSSFCVRSTTQTQVATQSNVFFIFATLNNCPSNYPVRCCYTLSIKPLIIAEIGKIYECENVKI